MDETRTDGGLRSVSDGAIERRIGEFEVLQRTEPDTYWRSKKLQDELYGLFSEQERRRDAGREVASMRNAAAADNGRAVAPPIVRPGLKPMSLAASTLMGTLNRRDGEPRVWDRKSALKAPEPGSEFYRNRTLQREPAGSVFETSAEPTRGVTAGRFTRPHSLHQLSEHELQKRIDGTEKVLREDEPRYRRSPSMQADFSDLLGEQKRRDDAGAAKDAPAPDQSSGTETPDWRQTYGPILKYVDIEANARRAAGMNLGQFINSLRPFGEFDYKNDEEMIARAKPGGFNHEDLEDFGNFHYGYLAAAAGYTLTQTLSAGGLVQKITDFQRVLSNIPDLLSGSPDALSDMPTTMKNARHTLQSIGSAYGAYKAAGFEMPRYLLSRGQENLDEEAENWTHGGFTWGDNPDDPPDIMQGWMAFHAPK